MDIRYYLVKNGTDTAAKAPYTIRVVPNGVANLNDLVSEILTRISSSEQRVRMVVSEPEPAPHIDRARTDQEGEIDNRLVESLPFSIYGSGFGSEGTVKVTGVDTDGQPKTVEIPSGAITSWADGEIRVDGEAWEPLTAQLDLANPIRIVAVCGSGESNALEATVYA